ncbi:pseudouridine synthase [Clostridia bacterium]|nr:pseudouridine synthase [Clostridia bacterium]
MRIEKLLVHAGFCSRSEARRLAAEGRVTLKNGRVFVDGTDADYREHYWIMLNKPKGVVCSTNDPLGVTALSLLPERYRRMELFPVGRLDKDSTGLVLMTDDGEAAHRLLSPKKHHEKLYYVKIDGKLTKNEITAFENGVKLVDNSVMQHAKLEILTASDTSECLVTLTEGKYHQIKRMFGVYGFPVTALKRLSIGEIKLDETLAEGEYRELTGEETKTLYKTL